MKQRLLWTIIVNIPMLLMAQHASTQSMSTKEGPGMTSAINWTTNLTWQQVKEKAKKENKYIFVDCFATWCKPCKEMDKKVYTVDSVGGVLNDGFVSVKLQMDQTKNDDALVKSWYKTASTFTKDYNLDAYPTMLFFAPSGKVATKEVGYKNPGDFITACRNAKDPNKQYYVLLKNYRKGKLDDVAKRSLIKTAKQLADTANYHALRDSYLAYLYTLPKEKLYTRENVDFIASVINKHTQRVFDMFYPNGSAVDKLMQKEGYSKKVVDDVIMKEKVANVVNAAIKARQEPDWNSLFSSIAKDYQDDYADRNVMEAKMKWYDFNRDVLKYATILNDKMEKYGSDTTVMGEDFKLNNTAYQLWMQINDSLQLARIAGWMAGVVRRGEKATGVYITSWADYIDTYANLLYKIGQRSDAINWQQLAVTKANELGVDDKEDLEIIESHLEKMKKKEPTWPIDKK